MARSGGPTVGLDIGSSMIKIAEVVPGRGSVSVRAIGMAPTPPNSMENNVIVDAQLLAQAVKALMKEAGISARSSVSSVSGQSALVVRVIEVPRMSDSELAETMRWEVERHVPFAANEVIMDFQPIHRPDNPPDAQNMEVLLAVAQQDMIDRHVEAVMAAGLKPAAIDVEPLAVARTYIELSPDPMAQRTVAIVNIGANNTDIGIFRDGILAFPRTLPLAGAQLTRAIASQMGVSEEQAEDLKQKHGRVILDQVAQASAAPGAMADAGFLDFSQPPMDSSGGSTPAAPAEPAAVEAAPGRTPFDFSGPPSNKGATPVPSEGPDSGGFSTPDTERTAFDLGEPAAPTTDPAAIQPARTTDPVRGEGLPATVEPVDPTTAQVFAAMAPVLSELLTELRRSLEYYRGRSSDGRIDEILLCGGTANLKNLDRFLETELGVPTRVASPLQYAAVSSKNFSQEYLESIASSFAVAIGLGARDMVPQPAAAGGGRGRRGKS